MDRRGCGLPGNAEISAEQRGLLGFPVRAEGSARLSQPCPCWAGSTHGAPRTGATTSTGSKQWGSLGTGNWPNLRLPAFCPSPAPLLSAGAPQKCPQTGRFPAQHAAGRWYPTAVASFPQRNLQPSQSPPVLGDPSRVLL